MMEITAKTEPYANIIPMAELDTKEKRLNPFPIYNRLRQTTPVRYDEKRSCWDVFRYEDVQRILKDPAAFSSRRGLVVEQKGVILTMDPPRHTQMRALVSKAFTPQVVNDLAPRITTITNDLLDAVQGKGRMEVVHDLAVPLPVIVIAELLGVPSQDRKLFKEWSDILVKGPDKNTAEAYKQIMSEKEQAVRELREYFAEIIKLRRIEPQEDLVSLLISAEIEGQKLDEDEVIGFSILLLAAGNETTTNLITNAVRRLTEDEKLQERLRANPKLASDFIEEVLRFYPPIQAIGRVVTKDIEIGGKLLKAGDQVVSWVASANRDENKFPHPDRFIVDRNPNPHLTFGFGIHFCLGAPLARLESKIAMTAILERLKKIQSVSGSELSYVQSPFVYGVKQFPVIFQ
ncbi:monooxygenase YjiB [Bacillaceae bacterium]